MQGLEPPGGACDPAAQRAAVKLDAMAGEDLRLPVQRQVPCKFCGHNMGHQRRADHATRHHPGRCRSLNDALLAVPAGILRTDRADDTRPRGHDIQRFADILADAHPQGATAGIACVFGFDDDLDAGQMPRQCPHVACRRARRGGLWRVQHLWRRRGVIICSCRHIRQVPETEGSLRGIKRRKLLGFGAEDHDPQQGGIDAQLCILGLKGLHEPRQTGRISWDQSAFSLHGKLYHAVDKTQTNTDSSGNIYWPFDSWASSLRPIQAGQEQPELLARQPHRTIPGSRPGEPATLKPLRGQNHATAIPKDQSQPVGAARSEDEDITAIRVGCERAGDDRYQSVDAAPEVDRRRGDDDFYATCRQDHGARNAATSAVTTTGSTGPVGTSGPLRSRARSGRRPCCPALPGAAPRRAAELPPR